MSRKRMSRKQSKNVKFVKDVQINLLLLAGAFKAFTAVFTTKDLLYREH